MAYFESLLFPAATSSDANGRNSKSHELACEIGETEEVVCMREVDSLLQVGEVLFGVHRKEWWTYGVECLDLVVGDECAMSEVVSEGECFDEFLEVGGAVAIASSV